jgi:hypothetical protein
VIELLKVSCGVSIVEFFEAFCGIAGGGSFRVQVSGGREECSSSTIGVPGMEFFNSFGVAGIECNTVRIVSMDCVMACRVKKESCKAAFGISVQCVKAIRVFRHPRKLVVSVSMDSSKERLRVVAECVKSEMGVSVVEFFNTSCGVSGIAACSVGVGRGECFKSEIGVSVIEFNTSFGVFFFFFFFFFFFSFVFRSAPAFFQASFRFMALILACKSVS